MKKFFLVSLFIWIVAILGYVQCIYKFCTSDFKPSYKREAIYGVSLVTGVGAITGWMDFPDTPVTDTTKH